MRAEEAHEGIRQHWFVENWVKGVSMGKTRAGSRRMQHQWED